MLREVLAELDAHAAKVPQKMRAAWLDQMTIESLYDPRTHQPVQGPRSILISMALNMGNESNAAKLAGGYGWREDAILRVLDAELAPEEWRYVQDVWDTIEKLWPKISELERRVNGVVPERIRPRVLNTSAGVLRGGYFPAVYDSSRSRAAGQQAAQSESRLYENGYSTPATSRGFTKERTEVQRPILLSLDATNRHVAEVVHDLTHREAVMQAWRFLNDRRILDAVDGSMGPEISGLFRPWLQNIANEWNYDRAGLGKVEQFIRGARRNTTFVGMAYRIGTMLSQLGGYTGSAERIGLRWMYSGFDAVRRNPKEAVGFALRNSHELRSRLETVDRDVKDNLRRLAGKTDPVAMVQRYGYSGIGLFDRIVVVPTWLGAYNKAIAAGMEEAQAIHEADSAVRESQGSGAAKDLAAIQRGRGTAGELGKLLTMFYSFQSALYQRYVELAWDSGGAWRERKPQMVPELAARAVMLTVVGPVMAAILAGQGPDDDSEESWTDWAAKLSLYSLVSPVPIVRDAVPEITRKLTGDRAFGYRFTPVQSGPEALARVAGDIHAKATGKKTTRATRNALEAAGYVTGAVPGQAAATAQFFVDTISGSARPENLSDWWEGIRTGKVERKH